MKQTTHAAVTHTVTIDGIQAYITVGLDSNGRPFELFLKISKQGSTLGGFAGSFARLVSTAMQYGVPLEVLCRRMIGQRFAPEGMTTNKEIPVADSIVDYIFRWLATTFLHNDGQRTQSNPTDSGIPNGSPDGSEERAGQGERETIPTLREESGSSAPTGAGEGVESPNESARQSGEADGFNAS